MGPLEAVLQCKLPDYIARALIECGCDPYENDIPPIMFDATKPKKSTTVMDDIAWRTQIRVGHVIQHQLLMHPHAEAQDCGLVAHPFIHHFMHHLYICVQ